MEETYNGVSASLSAQDFELSQAQTSITLTLSNLPGHYAVRVGLSTLATSTWTSGDSDTLSFDVAGSQAWSAEVNGSTGEGGTATVLHQGSSVAITFRADGFEEGDYQWLQEIQVALFRYRASISTVDGSATENTPGDKMEFKVVADLDWDDINAVGAGQNVDVDLLAPTGTATEGTDFGNLPRTKQVAAGPDGVVFGTEAIDDPDAEGVETVILALAPPAATKPYTTTQPATTQAVIKDDAVVREIKVRVLTQQEVQDLVTAGEIASGFPPQNHDAGFAFTVRIEVKGEALDRVEIRQMIDQDTQMWDYNGNVMTNEQQFQAINIQDQEVQRIWNTDGFVVDTGTWNWANLTPKEGSKQGLVHLYDGQALSMIKNEVVAGDGTHVFATHVTKKVLKFELQTRVAATPAVTFDPKQWGYTWSNENLLWNANDQPPPPANDAHRALCGAGRKGKFSDVDLENPELLTGLNP